MRTAIIVVLSVAAVGIGALYTISSLERECIMTLHELSLIPRELANDVRLLRGFRRDSTVAELIRLAKVIDKKTLERELYFDLEAPKCPDDEIPF